jgi:diguanylate cyclase (GGDEF)-like protein
LLRSLIRIMDDRSPVEVTLLSVMLLALIGLLHFLMGYEISFSIFYLIPIALVALNTPSWNGYLFCGISAVVWLTVDKVLGHHYSSPFIPYWDTGVRLAFFAMTTYLLLELKAHWRSENELAHVDGLTGCLNARAFKDVAQRTIALAERNRHPFVLAYLDIDDFKWINDGLGHAEGNHVLVTVANTIKKCIRSMDVVARLGGDEFAILLPDTNYAGAQHMFGRIHQALVQTAADGAWPIGFSIGVAVFARSPSTIDDALKIADDLMYKIKRSSKNDIIYKEYASAE